MRRHFYYCFIALISCASQVRAQYTITGHSITHTGSACDSLATTFLVNTSGYTSGLSVKAYFGHGQFSINPVFASSGTGYANASYKYLWPGTYSVKLVLYLGAMPIDSTRFNFVNKGCRDGDMSIFLDVDSDCVPSPGDSKITFPVDIEISKGGIPVDTISCIYSRWYRVTGPVGTIYSYRILSLPADLVVSCPASGILYDTITSATGNFNPKYFGLKCIGSPGPDAALYTVNWFTRGNHQASYIYVTNRSCTPTAGTVTVNFSPKYIYDGQGEPLPTISTGTRLTWDISALPVYGVKSLYYWIENNPTTGHLWMGDTVHSEYSVSTVIPDVDHSNDSAFVVDSVTSSYDPNLISVTPSGYISSAVTTLKYTIQFENTGTDTAFNISVYDTLSDNVDPETLHFIMASHDMAAEVLKSDGQNIIKFDFANINLPDSSHHGLCDGVVMYTINTRSGLAKGTEIYNRAGIYFDYNPVVMTNTVLNIVGPPAGIPEVSKCEHPKLFPNPVSDVLNIGLTADYSTFSTSNTVGQTVAAGALDAKETKVNVRELPTGIYYITLRGAGGVNVQKFEKR